MSHLAYETAKVWLVVGSDDLMTSYYVREPEAHQAVERLNTASPGAFRAVPSDYPVPFMNAENREYVRAQNQEGQ